MWVPAVGWAKFMESTDGSSTIRESIQPFLASKAKISDGEGQRQGRGNYVQNAERVLEKWVNWLDGRNVESFEQLEIRHLRQYARRLKRRVDADAIAGSTANTYYDYVRAFLSWCVAEELLEENPAAKHRAQAELPDDAPRKESQQFWTPEQREELRRFVERRVNDALDEHETARDALAEFRDRALAYVLAYTGARGGEALRDPRDARRTGITWADVDLDAGTIQVLGKSQDIEALPLPGVARGPLRRFKQVQNPPTDGWPVFPTRHAPTLYEYTREQLADRDLEGGSVEDLLSERGPIAVLRGHETAPPAMTTEGGRQVMRRLCADAEITLESGADYLQPHGGRRGIGELLYRESAELAQETLRHRSIETTHEAYSEVQVSQIADDVDDVLRGRESDDG